MFSNSVIVFVVAAAGLVSAAPQPVNETSSTLVKRSYTGTGTVYYQYGGYGSCGNIHSDYDMIVALTPSWQGSRWPPAQCGRRVQITNTGSNSGVGGAGNTVNALVADTCPGCHSPNSIDLSKGAWNLLTNNAPDGTINVSWNFI